jgi:MFS family permease
MREQIKVAGEVARDPRLLRLVSAFFGFTMGEFGTWVAILVYAYDRGGASAAGVVAAVQLIPAGIIAPFGAFAGDRFRRDRVLFVSYLAQAVALGLVALALFAGAPFALTLVFATAAVAGMSFTRPTQAAILPSVTESPEDLTAANAVSTLAENAGIVVGPLIAGLLLTRSGPAEVFALFALVTLVSALLVSRLGMSTGDAEPHERMGAGDVVRESLGGFRFLVGDRHAGFLVLVLSGGVVLWGALDVLYVATALSVLGKGQGWAGFLSSAAGLGGVVGAALAVGLVGRRRLVPSLGGGTVVFGGSVVAIGAAPAAATAPALFGVAGAGASVAWVAGQTLLQRIAPGEMLARVFGILEGMRMVALAVGSVSASALIAAFGVRPALIAVGAVAPFVMLASWIPLASIDRQARAPDPETLAFVRRMPIFAALPPPAIERILAHLTRVTVPAGEVFIREGATGDRFIMIVDGQAEVTRDGVHVTDRVAGDHVGEVALLRDMPRTATLTAKTPMTLLTLEREAFLEAVTGHPQSHERAQAIVEDRLPPAKR